MYHPPPNKAVFLDRDGTIVEDNEGYIDSPAKVNILPGAAEAIRSLNENGYLVIIVSNQSGIARGFFNEDTLRKINSRVIDLLAVEHAKIDDVFYCPHLPNGQIAQYSKICTCRKPLPGLIVQAVEKYDIDLNQSFMIGDSEIDIEAGTTAGCQTILISNNSGQRTQAHFIARDLKNAIEILSIKP